MLVTPCRVVPGEPPRAVLENIGNATVGYGPGFKLEKRTDEGWRWINRRQAFTLPLFYLRPGETGKPEVLAVYLESPKPMALEPAMYRVTKGLQPTPGKPRPPTMGVAAVFRVIR